MQIIYVVPKPNMEQTIKRMLNAIGCNLEVKTVYYEDKTEQYYGNIFLFHGYACCYLFGENSIIVPVSFVSLPC